MDFKKKLKSKSRNAVILIIAGVIAILGGLASKTYYNSNLIYFGIASLAIGVLVFTYYFRISRNKEKIKNRIVAENDERNIYIRSKARNIAFDIYVVILDIALIVFSFLNMDDMAWCVGCSMILFIMADYITYLVIRKRS